MFAFVAQSKRPVISDQEGTGSNTAGGTLL